MQRRIVVTLAALALSVTCLAGCQKKHGEETANAPATTPAATAPAPSTAAPGETTAAGATGEQLYKQHCASCHPDGGNPMNQKKTLHRGDMDANNIKTSDDIVKLIRNPGTGMTKFDENTLPDKDAKAIADYILATFK